MLTYVGRRLLHSVFVAVGVTILCFIFMHMSGDPTSVLLPADASDQDRAEFRERMGFNRPLYLQYLAFASKVIYVDFGDSYYFRQPVLRLIGERIPATIQLNILALTLALGVGIPLGIFAGTHRNTVMDRLAVTGANLGMAVPNYWLGMMLIVVFGVKLRLLPTSGRAGMESAILPALALGAGMWALFARLTRSLILQALRQEYIRTARAKGLAPQVVVLRHALMNVLIPLITVVGVQAGQLISGTVIVETVFAWPGIGRLIVQAIFARDYPVVQGCVLMLAFIFIVVNLVVDLMYVYLDPRVKLG